MVINLLIIYNKSKMTQKSNLIIDFLNIKAVQNIKAI